jgi:hypothetical protein
MKYFVIDIGKKMLKPCHVIQKWCKANEYHFLVYLTDEEYYLAMEDVTEDEFLNHFSNTNQNKLNGKA